MPTAKDARPIGDPVQNVLTRAELLLVHPALKNRPVPDQYAAIIAETNEELRTLQVRLTGHDPSMSNMINQWCQDKDTLKRLDNITSTLEALQMVTYDDAVKKHPQLQSEKKWQVIDRPTRHQIILHHCMHNQRMEKYDKPFINYLELGSFIKQQRATAETIKKLMAAKNLANSAVDVGGKIKTVVSTAKSLSMAAEHSSRTAEGLSSTAHAATAAAPALTSFLQAIPILSAGITAVKAAYDFGNSFLKKQGVSDKVANGVMLGVSAAAVALTVVFPVAAAGIAAGMVAAGVIKDYVKPFFDLRKQIKQRENEILNLDSRINILNTSPTALNDHEKKVLLSQVEKYFIENKDAKLTDLTMAKEAIRAGDSSKLNQNPIVKQALNLSQGQTIETHMQQQHQSMQANIRSDITNLTKEKNTKMALAVNGAFTAAGAIMLAIPFPPVMIAGAAILLASSVAGIAIRYREQIGKAFTTIKDGIKNLFGIGKPDPETVKDKPKPDSPTYTPVAAKQAEVPRIQVESTHDQILVSADKKVAEPTTFRRK